ncbi:MAG: hypothetical protein RIM84_19490 [Alphaproteobacteria bacterium]
MKTQIGLGVLAAFVPVTAVAHVGNHDHGASAGIWHFVTEPAHVLPVIVLAAVVVGGLVARTRYREKARRRIDES